MPHHDDEGVPEVAAPEGLVVRRLGEGLALLSFPLPMPRLPSHLSRAERDIATRVFNGQSNRDIARARGVSSGTIANQLEALSAKLGVSGRYELVLALRAR